jgi:hypothetical protein
MRQVGSVREVGCGLEVGGLLLALPLGRAKIDIASNFAAIKIHLSQILLFYSCGKPGISRV